MAGKQEKESTDNLCAFHLLFGREVELRHNGVCPMCAIAPSDDEQVQSYDDCPDEDYD